MSTPSELERISHAQLERVYQWDRAVVSALAGVSMLVIGFGVPWLQGALIGVILLGNAAHARLRLHRPAPTVLGSLLVDATVMAGAVTLAGAPPLVMAGPFMHLVLAGPLLVTGLRAVVAVGYTMLVAGAALLYLDRVGSSFSPAMRLLAGVAACVAAAVLIVRLLVHAGRASAETTRLRRRLDEREQRYQTLVEGLPIGLYRTTPDGRLITANQALAQLLGFPTPEALIASGVESVYHDAELRRRWQQAVERDGTVTDWEMALRRADGATIWVQDSARVVRDPSGTTLYYEGTLEDVTERKQAEAAVRESEERYRRLVEASPVPVAVHCEGVVVYANPAAAQLMGAGSTEDLIGRRILDFVHPEDRETVMERMRTVIAQGMAAPPIEERFIRFDGETVTVEVAAIPITYQGRPASQVVVHDVTARRKAEAEVLERNRELEGMFTLTADINSGRSVSEILERIFESFQGTIPYDRMEYASLEEDGRVMRTVWVRTTYPTMLLAEGHVYVRAPHTGTTTRRTEPYADNDLIQYASSRPPSSPVHLLVDEGVRASLSCPLIVNDVIVGYIFFGSTRPGAYQKRHAALVHRVAGQIAVALEQSRLREELVCRNQELEELIRTRTQFLANVSHEVRTPLTAVVGLTAELRDRLDDLNPGDVVDFAELIASSAAEVAGIVEDLLVIARVEAGQLSVVPEWIDLKEAAQQAVETWAPEEASLIEIEGGEAKVWADPLRVRQIVRNLCSNARRYGGSSLRMEVAANGASATLLVADDGDPIPEKDREAIFQAYVGAGADRTRSAVGLGLTVSRQLARAMGGDLTYDHVDGESRFSLRLPTED